MKWGGGTVISRRSGGMLQRFLCHERASGVI